MKPSGVGATNSANSMRISSGGSGPKPGDKWHLDGVQHYLWRAVDQHGAVIDILVQSKRDRFAAMRFFRKLLNRTGRHPRVIITDKLRSYGAAKRVVLPA